MRRGVRVSRVAPAGSGRDAREGMARTDTVRVGWCCGGALERRAATNGARAGSEALPAAASHRAGRRTRTAGSRHNVACSSTTCMRPPAKKRRAIASSGCASPVLTNGSLSRQGPQERFPAPPARRREGPRTRAALPAGVARS